MYKVIEYFTDLQDGGHAYNVGDEFPRQGMKVSSERLNELSGKNNKRGVPLIRKVKLTEEVSEQKAKGGRPKKEQ